MTTTTKKTWRKKKKKKTTTKRWLAHLLLEQAGVQQEAGVLVGVLLPLQLDALHHDLLLVVGVYGVELPNQNGAPIRLIVPWKYGFKSIKSIVRISFTEKQPPTTWNISAPDEYGFYANVNPAVDHPRWSQASERRVASGVGSLFASRQPTLPFNGYAAQVASLYKGLDLARNF